MSSVPRLPRVVYWDIGPNPYMTERFNAVAARGNVCLEAWFSYPVEPGRRWGMCEADWRFRHRYLPNVPGIDLRLVPPRWFLGSRRPDLLVSLYGAPTFVLGWATAKVLRVSTVFWCQVTFDSWSNRRPWKEAVKQFMFRRVDATLGGGPDSLAFARRYGVRPEATLELRHAIDVKHYTQARNIPPTERQAIRRDLGLRGVVFIYVGRLWGGKGVFELAEAFARLQRLTQTETTLMFVGDGPDEEALRRRCHEEGLPVIFAGFRQKTDLPSFYAVADIFVFPTLGDPYGLVVDEAMAAALPVISTSSAGEIPLRVDDGVTGFIVPPKNPTVLADRMKALAEDAALRDRMGRLGAERMAESTPERWAETFEEHVFDILRCRAKSGRISVKSETKTSL